MRLLSPRCSPNRSAGRSDFGRHARRHSCLYIPPTGCKPIAGSSRLERTLCSCPASRSSAASRRSHHFRDGQERGFLGRDHYRGRGAVAEPHPGPRSKARQLRITPPILWSPARFFSQRGHLTKRKKSYAKRHPKGRWWLTTALSPGNILHCPVEAYPSLTSGTVR